MKALIAAGADINQGGKYQNSPLHWAAVGGRMECVEALLRAGADFSLGNQNDNRPLHWATYKGNLECVQVLIHMDSNRIPASTDGATLHPHRTVVLS